MAQHHRFPFCPSRSVGPGGRNDPHARRSEVDTKIYTPKNATQDLSILILRTPYGIGQEDGFNGQLRPGGTFSYLMEDGYIFVFQDVRGKYESEGDVVIEPGRFEGFRCYVQW